MLGSRAISAGFSLFLATSLAAGAALAAPTAKERAEARSLVTQAKAAAKAGRWADAADAYRRADALDPSPQTELDLGRALASAGKLLDAKAALSELAKKPATNAGAKKVQ